MLVRRCLLPRARATWLHPLVKRRAPSERPGASSFGNRAQQRQYGPGRCVGDFAQSARTPQSAFRVLSPAADAAAAAADVLAGCKPPLPMGPPLPAPSQEARSSREMMCCAARRQPSTPLTTVAARVAARFEASTAARPSVLAHPSAGEGGARVRRVERLLIHRGHQAAFQTCLKPGFTHSTWGSVPPPPCTRLPSQGHSLEHMRPERHPAGASHCR